MTEKENHLPNLSSEERAHALELAIQARRRYAALKARVKSGELTFTDAMDEEDAKRILVTSLLQSVPGIGASKAVVIMRLYRIPKGRRVGGLGIRQREALVALEKNGWKLGSLDPDWFELELAGWQQAIKLMEDAVKLGKGDYVHRFSMELISSSQAMGTRGGGISGSWFPGKPETPQKRHGKGCGGTPFSMPFLLSH